MQDDEMILKDRLAHAMALANVGNQSELARACGVRPSAINMILSGTTKNISADLLYNASRFLRCNPEWLGVGSGFPTISVQDHSHADLSVPEDLPALSVVERRRPAPGDLIDEEQTLIQGYRLAEPGVKVSMLAVANSVIERLGERKLESKKA